MNYILLGHDLVLRYVDDLISHPCTHSTLEIKRFGYVRIWQPLFMTHVWEVYVISY